MELDLKHHCYRKAAGLMITGVLVTSPVVTPAMAFANDNVKNAYVAAADTNKDGVVSDEEKAVYEAKLAEQKNTDSRDTDARVDDTDASAKTSELDKTITTKKEDSSNTEVNETSKVDKSTTETKETSKADKSTEASDKTSGSKGEATSNKTDETAKPKPKPEKPEQNAEAIESDSAIDEATEDQSAIEEEPSDDSSIASSYDATSHVNAVITKYSEDLTTQKFIAVIGEQARQIAQEQGLYASVMIAQAIIESGSGNSDLAQAPNNNLFGIKGAYVDEAGESYVVNFATQEDDGSGSLYTIESDFRAYPTTKESLEDYAALLTEDMADYYAGAWKANAATYKEACDYLQGRYATDTSYSAKLQGIIQTYELTRYDEQVDYEIVGEKVATEKEMSEYLDSEDVRAISQEAKNAIKAEGVIPLDMMDYADVEAEAASHLGADYVWGGTSDEEGGYDCSGLVWRTYKDALDVTLPRTSQEMQHLGDKVDVDEESLRMGDLLFWQDGTGDTYHVAMYLSDGCFIESPNVNETVKVSTLEENTPAFAKRIINFENVDQILNGGYNATVQ